MGCSESEQLACKKHQNHNQLQGVCPFCLTERLSHLLSCATKQQSQTLSMVAAAAASCSSSLSSYYSSGSSSNGGSPPPPAAARPRHHRNVSEVIGSIALMLIGGGGGNGLKKSRSIISFVPRSFNGSGGGDLKSGKKKRGFWSRLLHLEKKKRTVLMHSRTMREVVIN